jgi:hypothetical protein
VEVRGDSATEVTNKECFGLCTLVFGVLLK